MGLAPVQDPQGELHHRGCQDQARPVRQDPRAVLPRRRRRCPHPPQRPGHRGTSASTTRRPTPASSRSTPTARSTGSASARSRRSPCSSLLKVTGDWQKFKGEPGAEGTLQGQKPKAGQAGAVRGRAGRRRRRGRARRHHAAPAEAPIAPSARRSVRRASRRTSAAAEPAEPAAAERRPNPQRTRRVVSVLEDALEHLVRGIVEHDDDVSVELTTGRRGRTLQIRVHPDDLGKVIGRGGRTATALRTVMSAVGGRGHPRRRRRHRPLSGRARRGRPDRPAARNPRRGHRSGQHRRPGRRASRRVDAVVGTDSGPGAAAR